MRNLKQQSVIFFSAALTTVIFTLHAQETAGRSDRAYQNKNDMGEERSSKNNNGHIQGDNRVRRDFGSEKHISVSQLIGKKVVNDQGERLGTIKDLIVSEDFTVKYAVLAVGGTLGMGAQKIAVPLNDLNCGGEYIRLSATKEDLKNTSKTPSGEWGVVSGDAWARNVNGYYGQPMAMTRGDQRGRRSDWDNRRFEREPVTNGNDREAVRAKQGAGAQDLIDHPTNAALFDDSSLGDKSDRSHSDSDLSLRRTINDRIQQDYDTTTAKSITVRVENGVAIIRGTVATRAEKQRIESRIKEVNGVTRVDNQLNVRD